MTIGAPTPIMQTTDPSHHACMASFIPNGSREVCVIDAAKAAADAVLDFCARRGMTEEANDLI
jgi:hypothetical protein